MILFRTRLTPKNFRKLKAYTRDSKPRKPGDPYWTDQDIVNEAMEDWFKKMTRTLGRRPDAEILADAHAINDGYQEPRGAVRKSKRKPVKR